MFYAKLESVLDHCRRCDALIDLSDFNAVILTERAVHKIYFGPHGFGTRDDNSSFLLNSCRIQKTENCGFLLSEATTGLYYNNVFHLEKLKYLTRAPISLECSTPLRTL